MYYKNNKTMNTKSQKGFTLLEILLVVAAIAILAGIVILAINPNKQLGDTRDSQRRMDVNTILNGAYQYSLKSGSMPAGIIVSTTTACGTVVATEICKSTAVDCTGYTSLSELYLNETYLTALPFDPRSSSATGTGYYVIKSDNNRVTVCAPHSEQSGTISVTR
jgi:prepilin-type N-terminal cleavage/methylation domain-containing protein